MSMSISMTGLVLINPCKRCSGMMELIKKYGPRNVGRAAAAVAKKIRSPMDPGKTLFAEMAQKIKDNMIIMCPNCGAKLTASLAVTSFYLDEVKAWLRMRYGAK